MNQFIPHILDDFISIEDMRVHTKTQDILRVTDSQLVLYRDASVEAAQLYTGLELLGQTVVTQSISKLVNGFNGFRKNTRIKLEGTISDGVITVVGGGAYLPDQILKVLPGVKSINLPVFREALDVSSCCGSCDGGGLNHGLFIVYKTGYASVAEIPAGIKLGCLKFVAWSVMHAGDEVLTVRNRERSEASDAVGSNNAAWVSGAIEAWRIYVVRS